MSGVTEILLIVAIILAVIMLPRIMKRPQENKPQQVSQITKIPGWVRVALVASILWPASVALYFKPWQGQWPIFLYVSIGPVLLAWGVFWIYWGFRKNKK